MPEFGHLSAKMPEGSASFDDLNPEITDHTKTNKTSVMKTFFHGPLISISKDFRPLLGHVLHYVNK